MGSSLQGHRESDVTEATQHSGAGSMVSALRAARCGMPETLAQKGCEKEMNTT